ncbi:MAG TPA: hypothetical protein VLG09_02525 [Candidatus Saccharimonadales bacterium]|nr:hypothetical protein [Candidatus Saccharimonadales bacterium]
MNVSIILACLGVGISLYGITSYMKGILKDGTQPRMASWAAWLTANTVFAVVAFHEGAYLAAGINAISAMTNAMVIILSLKQRVSMRPGDAIDWSCLIASVLCVVVTVAVPQNKTLGALFAVMANIVATIPTLRHAWTKPHEETWQMFAANVFAGSSSMIGIIIASGFDFTSVAGPLMMIIGNTSMVMITVGRTWATRVEEEVVSDIQTAEEVLTGRLAEGDE